MTSWERANRNIFCGRCHNLIAPDGPVLTITLYGVKRKLYRCPECAGESPPDLPPRVVVQPAPKKRDAPRKLRELATVRREWLPHPDD